ncbi:MAG TPA: carboxylesterase, partial [Burkholderiales bacterium]|nr:carboxylesterase [Burkholderiales bacterium]
MLALSTYLPLAETVTQEVHAANARTPIFMAHGSDDQVIPLETGEGSRDMLKRMGYEVEWREYPMPHSVCMEEIRDIAAWMRRVLAD